jgi:integrase
MKINKTTVDKLPPPPLGLKTNQKVYYDDVLKGFGVRVTIKGSKAFFIEKAIHGKLRRITLGGYPALTVEQARKEANKMLGKIATGIDPQAEKKAAKARKITLIQAFNDYVTARNSLKETTTLDYKRVLNQVMPDWQNKPLLEITKDMVASRHASHGAEKSRARANLAMRLLRAIFNFASGTYEDANGKSLILENPVKRLSHSRSWFRIERRQGVIKRHELAAWYKGLTQYTNHLGQEKTQMMKDYFLLILFTGLRREEANQLKWANIDLEAKTVRINDTKNREHHIIPLSDFLYSLLQRRKQEAINEYVFPAQIKKGHLTEPRKAMLRVSQLSGVQFTVHDLRRTFITVAESLDIPVYALKRLLNHKQKGDVTAGYIITDVERLRKPMQQITDFFLEKMGIEKPDLP